MTIRRGNKCGCCGRCGCGGGKARRALARAMVCGAIGVSASHTALAQDAALQSGTAPAQSGASTAAPPASEIGHATSRWLELQRGGAAASPHEPTMLGAEATLAYQRYLESFRTKIPASLGSSMDNGYTGNQLHVDYSNSGAAQN